MTKKKTIESFGIHRVFGGLKVLGMFGMLCFIGCSGEHVVEPEPAEKPTEGDAALTSNAIAFLTDLPEQQAVTRSTPLETYATSFKVWGYKNLSFEAGEYGTTQTVFPGFLVNWAANTAATTSTNTHDWEYVGQGDDQTVKYWDLDAKAYRFFAVAPATAGLVSSNTDNSLSITLPVDAADEASVPYYSHLWFSDNSDDLFRKPVTLEFLKPLAKVRFIITCPALPDGVSAPVLENFDFRPEDEDIHIALKGKVIITIPKQRTSTKETWETSWVDPTGTILSMTRPYTDTDQYWQTVLPILGPTESGGQGTYIMKVNVNGEEKTCAVPAHYMTWNPGYKYTYIFKINAEGALVLDNVWVGVTIIEIDKEEEYALYNW